MSYHRWLRDRAMGAPTPGAFFDGPGGESAGDTGTDADLGLAEANSDAADAIGGFSGFSGFGDDAYNSYASMSVTPATQGVNTTGFGVTDDGLPFSTGEFAANPGSLSGGLGDSFTGFDVGQFAGPSSFDAALAGLGGNTSGIGSAGFGDGSFSAPGPGGGGSSGPGGGGGPGGPGGGGGFSGGEFSGDSQGVGAPSTGFDGGGEGAGVGNFAPGSGFSGHFNDFHLPGGAGGMGFFGPGDLRSSIEQGFSRGGGAPPGWGPPELIQRGFNPETDRVPFQQGPTDPNNMINFNERFNAAFPVFNPDFDRTFRDAQENFNQAQPMVQSVPWAPRGAVVDLNRGTPFGPQGIPGFPELTPPQVAQPQQQPQVPAPRSPEAPNRATDDEVRETFGGRGPAIGLDPNQSIFTSPLDANVNNTGWYSEPGGPIHPLAHFMSEGFRQNRPMTPGHIASTYTDRGLSPQNVYEQMSDFGHVPRPQYAGVMDLNTGGGANRPVYPSALSNPYEGTQPFDGVRPIPPSHDPRLAPMEGQQQFAGVQPISPNMIPPSTGPAPPLPPGTTVGQMDFGTPNPQFVDLNAMNAQNNPALIRMLMGR